jgi:ABC-type polysaccharide/polyol phosphate export permease
MSSYANRRQVGLAIRDLIDGTRLWRIWYVLGVSELRQRYRRSTFGPFWVTLSVAVQALVMGYLLSYLFQTDINRQLPYICISLVTWTFIMGSINEGANCFIGLSSTILTVQRPLWTYMALTLWRNAIIYGHTFIVFFATALIFRIYPSATYLLAPVGVGLLLLNVGWMALVAGLISTRFRDVPLLITNLFTLLVWLSPVYYHVDQLAPKMRFVIELNPLTYVLDVARGPFINSTVDPTVWAQATAIAIFGWILAFGVFIRARSRVPFWL